MRVGDIGEFELIDRLRGILEEASCHPPASGLGMGDDAALLPQAPGYDWVLSCDAQLEGRHFMSSWSSPDEIGARAMAVNLSDIGAMGGTPQAALISLGLTAEMPLATVEGWYRGIAAQLRPWQAAVLGGNITQVDGEPFIDITAIGRVRCGRALRRDRAQPGDRILVTGHPGQAAAGLRLLRQLGPAARQQAPALVEAYVRPQHRVAVGRLLADGGWASAATDISDGLAADLANICRASGCGMRLLASRLPLGVALPVATAAWGQDPVAYALGPSDDYELVFTCPPGLADEAAGAVGGMGVEVAVIGEITEAAAGLLLEREDGQNEVLEAAGWDHFGKR